MYLKNNKFWGFALLFLLSSFTVNAQTRQKIGNNNMNISSSALLELESTTKGLLLPRMNKVQMNAILSPADGLMLYCTDCTPVGIYLNISSVWNGLSLASASTVAADGTKNGFEGLYTDGNVTTANNKFSLTLTNNGLTTVTINFAAGDVVLSGTGLGTLSPGAPSVSSLTIGSGQSQLISYSFNGSPVTGNVTANWNKVGISATQTVAVSSFASNFTVNCGSLNGSYVTNTALNASNTIIVSFKNVKAESAALAFSTSDLVLSGISGLTVSAVSPATATIATGTTTNVTYTLSGTPASAGTLTAAFSKNGLTCNSTKLITNGDATFASLPMDNSVTSINNGGSGDVQGIIDNASNIITYSVPYTGGLGTYAAYTSAAVAVTGQAGDSKSLTLTYPAGTFSSSGSLLVTVVVAGTGTFNVSKQLPGTTTLVATLPLAINGVAKGNVTITAVTGPIGGNAVADGTRPTTVVPITSSSGQIWMDRNLGASQKATSMTDYTAYGSLYQWGRGNDGHASITWTSGTAGTPVNGITSATSSSDNFGSSLFSTAPNWRSSTNNSVLWQGISGVNNPCPSGYRIPTQAELQSEVTAMNITDQTTAFNSALKIPSPGTRTSATGALNFTGTYATIFTSTYSGSWPIFFHAGTGAGSASFIDDSQAYYTTGRSVRCMKN